MGKLIYKKDYAPLGVECASSSRRERFIFDPSEEEVEQMAEKFRQSGMAWIEKDHVWITNEVARRIALAVTDIKPICFLNRKKDKCWQVCPARMLCLLRIEIEKSGRKKEIYQRYLNRRHIKRMCWHADNLDVYMYTGKVPPDPEGYSKGWEEYIDYKWWSK